jgi:Domain of unknown function (DUF4279)
VRRYACRVCESCDLISGRLLGAEDRRVNLTRRRSSQTRLNIHAPMENAQPTQTGHEENVDEPSYFRYSATLRIFGTIPDLDDLTRNLGVSLTHYHRRGERRSSLAKPYKHDMWSFKVPVERTEPLHVYIDALWATLRERKQYLLELKRNDLSVDVLLGYHSSSDNAGVEVPYQSLQMFLELQIPFGLSIIVA